MGLLGRLFGSGIPEDAYVKCSVCSSRGVLWQEAKVAGYTEGSYLRMYGCPNCRSVVCEDCAIKDPVMGWRSDYLCPKCMSKLPRTMTF